MDITGTLIGFFSGVLLAALSTYFNAIASKRAENTKKLLRAEYEMYLDLSDLYNWYFWLATNELHRKETDKDTIKTIYDIAARLATKLRENEESAFSAELINILYNESYPTYNARWKHMSELSEKMAKKVTPNHMKQLREISDTNIQLMAQEGFIPKAPATSRFYLGL
ncbi:hypothetical protein ACIGKM_15140 [Ectopseudomonas toyotomiensis]|uniref:hypothetical protein n=1 Tax=Ectopseudomonas toyotomiensis TaxID=554344 RepID=UPI0037C7A6C4